MSDEEVTGIPFPPSPGHISFGEEVKSSTVAKKKGRYPERLVIIMEEDPDWIPELSGKAVYRNNDPEVVNSLVDYQGIQIVASSYDPNMSNRHEVEVYVPFGTNYDVLPFFGTSKFHRRFEEHITIIDMTEIISVKESINMPMCAYLVPSKNSYDAAIELYDYPYTMMPLEHSCIANELGHSPKFVGKCNFASCGNLNDCSAYKPFEDVVVAKVDNKDVTLSRKINNGEIINEYLVADTVFESFSDLKKHAESENLSFEIVWSPISQPVSFLDKIVGRLEVTYPHEKV